MSDSQVHDARRAARVVHPDTLAELLAGRWVDPGSALPVEIPVRAVAIEKSLAGAEADLLRALDLGRRFSVVCDATTQRVLGARVARAIAPLGAIDSVVLDDKPHPDIATVERLRRATADQPQVGVSDTQPRQRERERHAA